MTDTPAPQPATKWWGRSMTIWGAVVTALSTVLPVMGPLIGIDISADLVQQLGDQVTRVVQAAGGLIGIIMTITGAHARAGRWSAGRSRSSSEERHRQGNGRLAKASLQSSIRAGQTAHLEVDAAPR